MADVYVQAGEEHVVDLIDGTSTVHLDGTNSHIAWGTGAGTSAKGDTTLFVEGPEARVVAVATQPSVDINQWVATITASAARTVTNAGLFTAITGGILIVKGDFTGIVLASGDKIEFTITLEQT